MNIISREMRANRKALIIWCVSMILLITIGMIKYQGFASMGEEANELMNNLPEVMKRIFGIGDINLTDIGGYYSIFYMYFALIAGIHAILLGASIISKEERDKTADFLLIKPIKRKQIVTSKIIASLLNIIILNIVTCVTSIIFVSKVNKGDSITSYIFKIMATLLVIQIVFFSIGLMISSLTKTAKKASSISTGVLLSTYILSMAISMYDKIEFLGYIIPFYYFDAKAILITGEIQSIYLLLSAIIIVVGIFITYNRYEYRDIQS